MKNFLLKRLKYIILGAVIAGGFFASTAFADVTPNFWYKQSLTDIATNTGNGLANANIHVAGCYIGLGTGTPCGSGGGASLTATFVGFGSASNLLTGTSDFTWNQASRILTINGAAAATQAKFDASAKTWAIGDITGGIGGGTHWTMTDSTGVFDYQTGSSSHFRTGGSLYSNFLWGDNGTFGNGTRIVMSDANSGKAIGLIPGDETSRIDLNGVTRSVIIGDSTNVGNRVAISVSDFGKFIGLKSAAASRIDMQGVNNLIYIGDSLNVGNGTVATIDDTNRFIQLAGGGTYFPRFVLDDLHDKTFTGDNTGGFSFLGASASGGAGNSHGFQGSTLGTTPTINYGHYEMGNTTSNNYFQVDDSQSFSSGKYKTYDPNPAVTFTGTGLDDVTYSPSSLWSGQVTQTFKIEIDSTGVNDTVKTYINNVVQQTGVGISGGNQQFFPGIVLTVGAVTGHTLGDSWSVTFTPVTTGWVQAVGAARRYVVIGADTDNQWNSTTMVFDDVTKSITLNNAFALDSMEVYSAGGNKTISDGEAGLYYDPAVLQANATITLPANPVDGQEMTILFGGTITGAGTAVVTNLTIAANTGQTLIGTYPTAATTDTVIEVKYRQATAQWWRRD